jgi:hypothetical protein
VCTSLPDEKKKVVMNPEAQNIQYIYIYIYRFISFGTTGRLVTTFYKKNFLTAWASFGSSVYAYVVLFVVYIYMASKFAVVRVESCLVF